MKHEYADPARHVEFSCQGCKHLEGPFGILFCVLKPRHNIRKRCEKFDRKPKETGE